MLPEQVRVEHLQQQILKFGADAYLRHPAEIATVFAGVTFAVYQCIEMLYCSRVGRSIRMVWRILSSMAICSRTPPVMYGAVWSICISLEEHRHMSVDVSIERGREDWWIGTCPLHVPLQHLKGQIKEDPVAVFVLDLAHHTVVSFLLLVDETQEQGLSLALYEALCARRRPHQKALTGVLWHLPRRIMIAMPLTMECRAVSHRLGVSLEAAAKMPDMVHTLQAALEANLERQPLSLNQCTRLIDRALDTTFGSGPRRMQEEHNWAYAHLAGYPQEPEWLFPLLRVLFPSQTGTISSKGVIEYDELHYTDDLLPYFGNAPVTLRRSPHTEARLWVYLEQDILCVAGAQELRRRNGTYRRARGGR